MVRWALIFFVISIISGAVGFTSAAVAAAATAKTLFYISVALFSMFLILGFVRR